MKEIIMDGEGIEQYLDDPEITMRIARVTDFLEANGIDSSIYTGYAFGMGVERITNLKYQVKDLRMFSENDVRFLEEFESAH